ncbi:uncharacterized protein LOC135950688 [Calliphora vicina]|uniref:uncharacterized protein LOC135950688 n=1 Tax=Calliphora vicina TaxID=7373 RepID=UPI00325B5533
MSQPSSGSSPAGTKIVSQEVAPSVAGVSSLPASSHIAGTSLTPSAAVVPPQNVSTIDVTTNQPIVIAPSVAGVPTSSTAAGTTYAIATTVANVQHNQQHFAENNLSSSAQLNLEGLQSQINILKAQLLNAQRALSIATNANSTPSSSAAMPQPSNGLQKALKGDARECVKSLLIHSDNVGMVMEQLCFQYGRPEMLIRCQLQPVKEIASISESAVDKLLPFAVKVWNLAAFLETANGQQHLANPTLMEELVGKLPMSKRMDKWLKDVADLVRMVQTTSGNRQNNEPKRKVVLHTADGQRKQQECPIFCRYRKTCPVDGCLRKHNKLLHDVKINDGGKNELSSESPSPSGSTNENESVLSCVSKAADKGVLLFRVVPIVLYGPSYKIETYALLDEGSSVTMVDSSLVKKLGLQGHQSQLNLNWYAGKASQETATVVDKHVSGIGKQRKYALRNVYGVSNLKLPAQSFNMDLSRHPGLLIKLYNDVVPKVLIGLDHCLLGLPDEIVSLDENGPYAANTPLRWVVFGKMMCKQSIENLCLLSVQPEQSLYDLVANYFETQNFGVKLLPVIESKDDLRARKILNETTVKIDGRFQTRLLWRADDVVLPDSYSMALNRLVGIERKMKRSPEFGAAYKSIIKDYLSKRYVCKLSPIEAADLCPRTWYLPHFGVINPNKPGKIRLVFDVAATVEGVSVNSKLLKGPQQYKPLPSVLFNFRVGAVAVCGDIKEMFHQVIVAPEDRCSQRFLWREDTREPPISYEMLVMTFGAACSPYVAHYMKETNALSYRDKYPRAVKSIVDHHYVDDFVDSFPTPARAIEIAKQVRDIHKAAGFELRNFSSNSSKVIVALKGTVKSPVNFSSDVNQLQSEKILGMYWQPKDDTFRFNLKFHNVNADVIEGMKCPTKRELLSVVIFRRTLPVPPLMGSLPKDRLTPYIRPFSYTVLDYFGPLIVTVGRRHEKRWVALFTCLTIRAIHLEVAFDLSTDACILAIRNFINRRGLPTRLRSDNGTNFVGADKVAKRFNEVFDVAQIQDELTSKGIDWQFNCPHNPAEGGIWERMWLISRQLRDHFWNWWIKEYLPTLTRRSKWCQRTKPIAIGDLVLICDPAVFRRDWKRGRVEEVFKGRDGVIRRADVRTCTGILKRPVSKLAVLDLE